MSDQFILQELPNKGTILWVSKNGDQHDLTKEIWRSAEVIGFPNYEVSNYANIKSLKNNFIRNGSKDGSGYLKISLYKDGKEKCFGLHRLVALLFVENPENKPTVDHIDRNRTNNHFSNLRWATQSEQNVNRKKHVKTKREVCSYTIGYEIVDRFEDLGKAAKFLRMDPANLRRAFYEKKVIHGHYWHFTDVIENERDSPNWLKYKYPGYHTIEVSDTGLIRKLDKRHKGAIAQYGRISPGSLRDNGYYRTSLNPLKNNKLKRISIDVHKLVMLVFVGPEDDKVINHIDGNKRNNHLENLEYVTQQQNSQHSVDNGLSRISLKNHFQPVNMLDLEGNFIRRYSSIKEAAEDNNCTKSNISKLCNGIQKTCKRLPGITFERAINDE